MDIGQMARPLLGDTRLQPQDTKALELKSGQVVRGVVLQVLDDQEALVSINGTPVKARLETPLQPGQASWMQVQPESSSDAGLVLKMVRTGPQSSDEAIARQLKELGLKDTTLNRELLRHANDMGIELQAKDARALATFLSRHEAPIDSARWIQSALITLQRGLPLTSESVQSVAQAVYGKPLTQQLSSMLTQLKQLMDTAQSRLGDSERQWLGKLIDGLDKWLAAASGKDAASVRQGQASAGGGNPTSQPASAQANSANLAGIANAGTRMPAAETAAQQAASTAAQGESAAAAMRHPLASPGPHAAGGSLNGQQISARAAEPATASAGQQAVQTQPSVNDEASGARAPQTAATASQANGALIRNLLVALGLGHEHQLLKALVLQQPEGQARTGASSQPLNQGNVQPGAQTSASRGQQAAPPSLQQAQPPGAQGAQMLGAQPAPGAQTAHQPIVQSPQPLGGQWWPPSSAGLQQQQGAEPIMQPGAQTMQQPGMQFPQSSNMLLSAQQMPSSDAGMPQQAIPESIKSLLLQAANSEQLPQALRESIQQAVQSITGQQLLMSADRSAPVTYITLFVPLMNEQGEHMASVHIQTKKGRRGGLDSDNCHLLFDLRMSALGEMMIDVQVTERIVSLQIYNDHPLMKRLAEEGKEGIQQALADMGYRLSMVKVTPLPDSSLTGPASANGAAAQPPANELKKYTAGSTYKGVDLRI